MPEKATFGLFEWVVTVVLPGMGTWLGFLQVNKISESDCKKCVQANTKYDEAQSSTITEMHADIRQIRDFLMKAND